MTHIFVIVPFICLSILLFVTRRYDSFCWWLFRLLVTCSLICFIYVHLDSSVSVVFIRFGDMALSIAILLYWFLSRKPTPKKQVTNNFAYRINQIFKKTH